MKVSCIFYFVLYNTGEKLYHETYFYGISFLFEQYVKTTNFNYLEYIIADLVDIPKTLLTYLTKNILILFFYSIFIKPQQSLQEIICNHIKF